MPFLPPRLTLVERRRWRSPQFGVILVRGLDRPTLTPVRRSAEGVASRRPTCESQAPILCATRSAIDLTVTACCRGVPVCPPGPGHYCSSFAGLRRTGKPGRNAACPHRPGRRDCLADRGHRG